MKDKIVYAVVACVLACVAAAIAKFAPDQVGTLALPLIGVVVVVAAYLKPPAGGGGAAALVLCGTLVFGSSGCALLTPKNARSVFDAAKVACIMQSFLTDDKQLAKICDVAEEMMPTLRELIAMRDAANKTGVKYGDAAQDK